MKYMSFVFGLISVAGLVGCESIERSFSTGIVQSLSHLGGGITQQDISMESFRRHMSASTGKHVIVIHCSVSDYASPYGGKIAYNARISQQTAYRILDAAIAQSLLILGWQPTMAVLVFPKNGARQMYSVPNIANIPTYVASSEIVEDGSVLHDVTSTNMLKLADATDKRAFPYETNSIRTHILDEINDCNINLDEGFKGVAMSPAEVAQLNQCRRTNYLHAVSIKWPSLLPDANGASDILCISWEGRCGTINITSGSGPKWMGAFGVAMVSAKDSVVYYFRKKDYQSGVKYEVYDNLMEPANGVILELERIKEIRGRTP